MDKTRIDAITGLRGLAALMVVYQHSVVWLSLPWKNHFSGEVGVIIFFSLSGFLMAYLYLGKKFSALSVTEYAISRMSRIAPAYLFIVSLSFLIYAYIDPGFVYDISSKNIARHLLFAGNVSVFWSIPPEVQFYVLFVLIWAAVSLYVTRFNVVGLLLLAFSFAILISYRDVWVGTFVGSKLHYFLFGVIAGLVRSNMKTESLGRISINILHAILIASMISAGAMIFMGHGSAVLPFTNIAALYNSISTAIFSALMVFSFSFPSELGKFFLENKLMVFCGECSFSLYLLNTPLLYVCRQLFPMPLQTGFMIPFIIFLLALSWLSYRLVERPGARLIKAMGNLFKRKFVPLFPPATGAQSLSVESDTR